MTGSSVIDLVITHHNISNNINNIQIADSTLSHHSQVSFELSVDKDLILITNTIKRYRLNENKFREKLEEKQQTVGISERNSRMFNMSTIRGKNL